ncbi:MAG: DUF1738 domain-containing protein [Rhodospirillaceae bacterium]|nr:MAG: DUF1738 domain-containing protein [Rhodospirillaceae bacterium]
MRFTDGQRSRGQEGRSLYQEVTDRIIAELEQGTVPWVKPWADSALPLGMPRNVHKDLVLRPYKG